MSKRKSCFVDQGKSATEGDEEWKEGEDDEDNEREEEWEDADTKANNSSRKRPKSRKHKQMTIPDELGNNTIADAHACSVCGCLGFASLAEAEAHQTECLCRRGTNKHGPWKCVKCGKYDFTTSQGFASHRVSCCHKNPISSGASLTLRPTCLESQRESLSDFNYLVTESIEFIEATSSDVKRLGRSQRKRDPLEGNIGIRCVYCQGQTSRSISFPDDCKALPNNIYNMTKRHLMESCPSIPSQVRTKLTETKQSTTSQSMMKDRIGLPIYLKMVQVEFGLTDHGKKEGIRCSIGERGTGTNSSNST